MRALRDPCECQAELGGTARIVGRHYGICVNVKLNLAIQWNPFKTNTDRTKNRLEQTLTSFPCKMTTRIVQFSSFITYTDKAKLLLVCNKAQVIIYELRMRTPIKSSCSYSSGFSRSHMMASRRHKSLSTKIAVIDAVEVGTKLKSEVADYFGLSKSTVSTILKNKAKLRGVYENSKFELQRKRIRTAVYGDIEEALFTWFKQARNMNIPVSGPILTWRRN